MPSTTITIAAPSENVYDLIADIPRMGEWSPETTSAEWRDGATRAEVGACFRGKNKRRFSWSTTCTITAADRGRALAFDVAKGETRWRYDLLPVPDGGCEVTESFEIVRAPGAIGRWMTQLGTGIPWAKRETDMLDGMQQTLQRLKAAAESR